METKKPKNVGKDFFDLGLSKFIKGAKADQHTSNTASPQVKPKKVTYYINNPELIKKLKQVGLDTDRDLSDLASEAIEDLVTKYTSKTA
jgi:hypothetical protein|tara:strand:+ start:1630 stop:1896 length:267 start_codon:yes stop_codon:yes gene_type:complete